MQDGAFHARHELNDGYLADVLNELVDDVVAEVAVGHLAATEAEAGLDLVAAGKEVDSLIFLGLVVVLVDGDREFDFLDDDDFLLLLGGAFALFLLVEEAAVILDAADGRNRVGRNLYEVESALAGDFECFKGGQDAELFAVFVDYADFARANPIVDANKRLCRTFVECDGTPPINRRYPRRGFWSLARARTHGKYSIGTVCADSAVRVKRWFEGRTAKGILPA